MQALTRAKTLGGAAAGLATALSLTAGPVLSQTHLTPQYSASEFAKAMLSTPIPCGGAEARCPAAAKSRGFKLVTLSADAGNNRTAARPPTGPADAASSARTGLKAAGGAANVLVTFRSGSAEITPQARANLKSVAEGMQRASLASSTFQIAGYTDTRERPARKLPLSRQRAEVVMSFLVGEGVKADRLSAKGYGSDPLVDPSDPTAEANRRVEIHRLD